MAAAWDAHQHLIDRQIVTLRAIADNIHQLIPGFREAFLHCQRISGDAVARRFVITLRTTSPNLFEDMSTIIRRSLSAASKQHLKQLERQVPLLELYGFFGNSGVRAPQFLEALRNMLTLSIVTWPEPLLGRLRHFQQHRKSGTSRARGVSVNAEWTPWDAISARRWFVENLPPAERATIDMTQAGAFRLRVVRGDGEEGTPAPIADNSVKIERDDDDDDIIAGPANSRFGQSYVTNGNLPDHLTARATQPQQQWQQLQLQRQRQPHVESAGDTGMIRMHIGNVRAAEELLGLQRSNLRRALEDMLEMVIAGEIRGDI